MRAGEDSGDEKRMEVGKEEDVSDAQHSGASSRTGILNYEYRKGSP